MRYYYKVLYYSYLIYILQTFATVFFPLVVLVHLLQYKSKYFRKYCPTSAVKVHYKILLGGPVGLLVCALFSEGLLVFWWFILDQQVGTSTETKGR